MAQDELLNVAQAAAHLGIRPWTLRHWISAGKIDIVKYGNGVVRIRRSVLDRYVAACTIKAKSRQRDARTKEPGLLDGTDLAQRDESLVR